MQIERTGSDATKTRFFSNDPGKCIFVGKSGLKRRCASKKRVTDSLIGILLLLRPSSYKPQWRGKIECAAMHECESKTPYMFRKLCLSKDILESR